MSNDPFANTATADPFAGDPPAPADEVAAEVPTVDREGQPVEGTFDPISQTVTPAEAQTTPEAPEAPQEAPEAPQTPEDPGTGDVSPAVPTQPDATPQPESERTGPRGGKGEMRHYKLLYQTGPAQWTEYDLSKLNDAEDTGIKVVKVDEELWYEARNNEHANRLGYTIVGRPKEGARIFPVPRGAYKPKTVKPAPPKPERERVVIS